MAAANNAGASMAWIKPVCQQAGHSQRLLVLCVQELNNAELCLPFAVDGLSTALTMMSQGQPCWLTQHHLSLATLVVLH